MGAETTGLILHLCPTPFAAAASALWHDVRWHDVRCSVRLDACGRYFWLTDSCPRTVKDVLNKAPFDVVSLAGPIAAALQI